MTKTAAKRPMKPIPKAVASMSEDMERSPLDDLLDVVGIHRTADGSHSLVVRRPGTHLQAAISVPLTLLAPSRSAQLQELFLKGGAVDLVSALAPKELSTLLLSAANQSRAVVLDREGVQQVQIGGESATVIIKAGTCYWLDDRPQGAVVTVVGKAAEKPGKAGTLEQFNQVFASILASNPRVLVSLCFALAAYLFKAFDLRPISLLLVGPTSTGKTTVQAFVSFLVTGFNRLNTLNATEHGLHAHLAASERPIVFLEDAHGDGAAGPLVRAFMDIGNGAGRMRSQQDGGLSPMVNIDCALLGSAEWDIKSTARAARLPLSSGVFARAWEVHLGQYGIFDALGEFDESANLAKFLTTEAPRFAGVVGDALVEAVASNWKSAQAAWPKQHAGIRKAILDAAEIESADGVNGRLLDSLSFCVFVGGLAVTHGVLTVRKKDISNAFGKLFREHVDRLDAKRTPVAQSVIEAVRHFIQTNPGKFLPLANAADTNKPNGLAGYVKRVDGAKVFHFFPVTFREKFVDRFGTEAYGHLRDAGFMVAQESRHNLVSVRVPSGHGDGNKGKRQDFVAIRDSILDADKPP